MNRASADVTIYFRTIKGDFEVAQIAGNKLTFRNLPPEDISYGFVIMTINGHQKTGPVSRIISRDNNKFAIEEVPM